MKKVVFLAVLVLCATFAFVSCTKTSSTPFAPIVIDESASSIEDGQVIAPNSVVKLAWTDLSGNKIACDFVLTRDGVEVQNEKNVTEVLISAKEEGSYEAILTVAGSRAASKKISFKATNLYRELYQSSNGVIYADDVNGKLSTVATDATILFKFYKYDSYVLPGTNETINDRKRMTLVDTDGDHVYDAWELFESGDAANHPYVALKAQRNNLYGLGLDWNFSGCRYYEDKIIVLYSNFLGTLSMKIATVGFDLNVPHAKFFKSTDDALNDYNTFMLRERYNSDNKPVFELEGPEAGARTFEVKISADHVADFAKVYDTKYMQLGVKFDDSLELTNVAFTNFFAGERETSSYKMNDTNDAAVLFKAVLDGAESTNEAPSSDFAVLTFEVKSPTEATNANISLVYEGWWDGFTTYPTAPNAMWKDEENRNVDGFLVDANPINVEFGGEGE